MSRADNRSDNNTTPKAAAKSLMPVTVVPYWLPLANRLKPNNRASADTFQHAGPAPSAEPTPATPPGPVLPFQELPAHQLQRQNYAQRMAPGRVRFGVPPATAATLEEGSAKARASLSIQAQLYQHYKTMPPPDIKFFKQNKQLLMEILKFPQRFNSSTPLEINGEFLVFIGVAAAVEVNWITVLLPRSMET
ncbi:hypothetical protein NDA16_001096 [Ustilago loliicola]|nr:hypothetical protein NDA16_001096 [Ustilago loliicola]